MTPKKQKTPTAPPTHRIMVNAHYYNGSGWKAEPSTFGEAVRGNPADLTRILITLHGLEHDGNGVFSMGGIYTTANGQYARPQYKLENIKHPEQPLTPEQLEEVEQLAERLETEREERRAQL